MHINILQLIYFLALKIIKTKKTNEIENKRKFFSAKFDYRELVCGIRNTND